MKHRIGRARGSRALAVLVTGILPLAFLAANSASAATPAETYDSAVLADSPTGYWPLREASGTTTVDRAGGPVGVVENNVKPGNAPGPIPGTTAFTFGGAACDGVNLDANGTRLQLSQLTVEAWVRTSSTRNLSMVLRNRSFGYTFVAGVGGVVFEVYPVGRAQTTTPINDGKWHHIVGMYGTSGASLYVDGVLLGTGAYGGEPQYTRNELAIGRDGRACDDVVPSFEGDIANVAVYPRALSGLEVAEHYRLAPPSNPNLNIVVVGDSYSAGNGAGGYAGTEGCYRSDRNWAGLYRNYLAGKGYKIDSYVNVACSGGVTQDFGSTRKVSYRYYAGSNACPRYRDEIARLGPGRLCMVSGLRPQIEAIKLETDLVLFTFGGNDANFEEIVERCFARKQLGRCRARVREAQRLIDNGGLRRRLEEDVLQPMRNKMNPAGNIVMVGYPPLVADNGYTLKSNGETYFAGQELLKVQRDANAVQAAIARDQPDAGARVTFVTATPSPDPRSQSFVGHEPIPLRCATPILGGPACVGSAQNPNAWVNGILATRLYDEWYHPNSRGHAAYRDLLVSSGPL